MEVVKCFQMGGNVIHGRTIAWLTKKLRKAAEQAEKKGLVKPVDVDTEVEMNGEDKEEDEEDKDVQSTTLNAQNTGAGSTWVSCLAASNDGQWLVSSDTSGRVTIFNLDTLQVRSSLAYFYQTSTDFIDTRNTTHTPSLTHRPPLPTVFPITRLDPHPTSLDAIPH